MSTEERHIFYSAVVQVPSRLPIDDIRGSIPVLSRLYKQTRIYFDGPEDYDDIVLLTLVAREGVQGPPEFVPRFVAQQLSQMSIPRVELLPIVNKLSQKLSVVSEVPSHMPITVLVIDITVSLRSSAHYDQVVDWIAEQTFRYLGHVIRGGEVIGGPSTLYKGNRTPAARSFIYGLKRLRFDSLEESVIRDSPTCPICIQDFGDFVEELITCMPCKHHYHVNCIVLCLEINHICPMCRYPMPTEEEEACRPLSNATAD